MAHHDYGTLWQLDGMLWSINGALQPLVGTSWAINGALWPLDNALWPLVGNECHTETLNPPQLHLLPVKRYFPLSHMQSADNIVRGTFDFDCTNVSVHTPIIPCDAYVDEALDCIINKTAG